MVIREVAKIENYRLGWTNNFGKYDSLTGLVSKQNRPDGGRDFIFQDIQQFFFYKMPVGDHADFPCGLRVGKVLDGCCPLR